MFTAIWHWFNDPLVQSVLVSPLVGAIFGVLLGGLSGPPSPGGTTAPRVFIYEKRTIVVRERSRDRAASSDPMAEVLGWVFALAVALWLYARYSYSVLQVLLGAVLCCLAFVTAVAVILYLRRYPRGFEWYAYVLAPLVGLLLSLYLIHLAEAGISAEMRTRAAQLGVIPFFTSLSAEEQQWVVWQIAGSALLTSAVAFSVAGSLYLTASFSLSGASRLQWLWVALLRGTSFASGRLGLTFLILLNLLALLVLRGLPYVWFR